MTWKTFLQILLLVIIISIVFYLIYPKYHFTSADGFPLFRCNIITGKIKPTGVSLEEMREAQKERFNALHKPTEEGWEEVK